MAFGTFGAILFAVSLARRTLSALAVVSSLGAAGWCRADPPTYADVPRVSTSDVAFFRGLFQSSGSSALRIALIGDSQETVGGWGAFYVAFLNARMAAAFGPCSETGLLTNFYAVEGPYWMAATRRSVCGGTSPALGPTEVLPAMDVHRIPAGCGLGGIPVRALLLHDMAHADAPELVGGNWFAGRESCVAEALVLRRPGSSGVLWSGQPLDGTVPAEAPSVASGELLPTPGAAGSYEWLSTPVLGFGGRRHLQVAMSATDWGNGLDLVGFRFRSTAANRGVIVHSFSKGGFQLAQLLPQHGGSGPMLKAWNPGAVMIQLGANDAVLMPDPESWRPMLEQAITWTRAAMGDPSFPVIIASDLRGAYAGQPASNIDRMPAIAHEIAMQDPRVLAVNLRRITEEEYLWGPNAYYLYDAAHLRPYAQRLLAEAFVGELCAALAIPYARCPGVPWPTCVRTIGAYCDGSGCRRLMNVEAAELGISWAGPGSTCDDADGDGRPDICPDQPPPDFNNDGVVDGNDLGILLSEWGVGISRADVNGDGAVDGVDLGILLASWGPVAP
ncbi:MAG: dockerin type I domain-containing protein [Phycisphaerales bacterium]